MEGLNGPEEVFWHPQGILCDDPIIQQQGRSFDIERPSDVMEKQEEGNQEKMEIYHPRSPYHVIDISVEKGIQRGDLKKTDKCNIFMGFCSSKVIHSTPQYRGTIWATIYAVQFGQVFAVGNPFDKISHSTITGKDSVESLLSFGQANSMFLSAIIWSAMFFLNFIYTAILGWSLPYRVPAISMLVLSLVYCILALAGATSGFIVLCGAVKISGLLFVSGGAMSLMLLLGFIIMGVCATWRFSLH